MDDFFFWSQVVNALGALLVWSQSRSLWLYIWGHYCCCGQGLAARISSVDGNALLITFVTQLRS
jgi:hypothetical protein